MSIEMELEASLQVKGPKSWGTRVVQHCFFHLVPRSIMWCKLTDSDTWCAMKRHLHDPARSNLRAMSTMHSPKAAIWTRRKPNPQNATDQSHGDYHFKSMEAIRGVENNLCGSTGVRQRKSGCRGQSRKNNHTIKMHPDVLDSIRQNWSDFEAVLGQADKICINGHDWQNNSEIVQKYAEWYLQCTLHQDSWGNGEWTWTFYWQYSNTHDVIFFWTEMKSCWNFTCSRRSVNHLGNEMKFLRSTRNEKSLKNLVVQAAEL